MTLDNVWASQGDGKKIEAIDMLLDKIFSKKPDYTLSMEILPRAEVQFAKAEKTLNVFETDIEEIILRLNNYPRPLKGYKTPIQLLEEDMGSSVIIKLGLRKIPLEELNMHYILRK
jgi:hypothetical protein